MKNTNLRSEPAAVAARVAMLLLLLVTQNLSAAMILVSENRGYSAFGLIAPVGVPLISDSRSGNASGFPADYNGGAEILLGPQWYEYFVDGDKRTGYFWLDSRAGHVSSYSLDHPDPNLRQLVTFHLSTEILAEIGGSACGLESTLVCTGLAESFFELEFDLTNGGVYEMGVSFVSNDDGIPGVSGVSVFLEKGGLDLTPPQQFISPGGDPAGVAGVFHLTPGRYTLHASVQSQYGAGLPIRSAQALGFFHLVAEDMPEPASCLLVGPLLVLLPIIRRRKPAAAGVDYKQDRARSLRNPDRSRESPVHSTATVETMKTQQFTTSIPAVAILVCLAVAAPAQKISQPELLFREALHKQQVEGDLSAAIKLYERVVSSATSNRPLAAKALLELARCYEKQGNAEARKTYERLVRDFADQSDAARQARLRLAELSPPVQVRRDVIARKLSAATSRFPLRTVSADGRYSAYVDLRNSKLTLIDLTTGTERGLGTDSLIRRGFFSLNAAISPDGSQVAYSFAKEGASVYELRMIPVKGDDSRVIARDLRPFFIVDWSRDGSSLLLAEVRGVVGDGSPQRWLLINLTTGKLSPVPILAPTNWVMRPGSPTLHSRLSPDSRLVAYSAPEAESDSRFSVFVSALDGSNRQKISGQSGNAYVFGWSPGGARILYISDRSGSHDLYSIAIRAGKPEGVPALLKKEIGRVAGAGVADNGRLYYSISTAVGEVYLGDLDRDAATVRNLQQIDQPPGQTSSTTQWSPDGRQLMIQRQFTTEVRIANVLRDVATGEERAFKTPYDGRASAGRWTADGKSFVLMLVTNTSRRLVLTDMETWGVRASLDLPGQEVISFGPNTAPAGEYVFASKGNAQSRNTRLMRIRIETGEEKEICETYPLTWAISPDGTQA
ncbi:MAG: hypothetical protein ACRD8O_07520, partial [Bryobacteraceae bacterium]